MAATLDSRAQFEAWISKPPLERSIERFPNDPEKHGWPGSYKDIFVDLAWAAWQEARL